MIPFVPLHQSMVVPQVRVCTNVNLTLSSWQVFTGVDWNKFQTRRSRESIPTINSFADLSFGNAQINSGNAFCLANAYRRRVIRDYNDRNESPKKNKGSIDEFHIRSQPIWSP